MGPIAGWPPHQNIETSRDVIDNVLCRPECYAICEKENNVAIGSVELKLNGHTDMTDRDDECELGFVYHHTCDDVPVPLLNEVRIGHTSVMTKEHWNEVQI